MQGLMKWILLDMSQKLTVEVKQRPLKSNGFAGIVDELNTKTQRIHVWYMYFTYLHLS